MSWDDLLNCVCQTSQHPSVQNVLDAIRRTTVCTDAGCFETEADAFGIVAPQRDTQNTMNFMVFVVFAMLLATGLRRQSSRSPEVEKMRMSMVRW